MTDEEKLDHADMIAEALSEAADFEAAKDLACHFGKFWADTCKGRDAPTCLVALALMLSTIAADKHQETLRDLFIGTFRLVQWLSRDDED